MAISHDARRPESPSSPTDMSMMRIAIAGTGGLARMLGYYINETTSHQVVFLSRTHQQQLVNEGYQVAVVDYSNIQSLRFALRGTDTVISTVSGAGQVELIHAAVSVRVRRFAPAEFEGLPRLRSSEDVTDRSKSVARQWLAHYARQMQFTIFCCGILYERFQPGGMARLNLGRSTGVSGEGEYIMDCRRMTASAPIYDAQSEPIVTITMTALQDVGRFVTKALDMPRWPNELKMCGTRMQVRELINTVQGLKGQPFAPIRLLSQIELQGAVQSATGERDALRQIRLRALLSTAEGCYDFRSPNLNQQFPDVMPIDFATWFRAKWQSA